MLDRFGILLESTADVEYLAKNPNLTSEQVQILWDMFLEDNLELGFKNLAQVAPLTDKQFRYLANLDVGLENLAQNPNLTTGQVDMMLAFMNADEDKKLYPVLSAWPPLTDEQIDKLEGLGQILPNFLPLQHIAQNEHLTSKQIDRIFRIDEDFWASLSHYSPLTDEQFDLIITQAHISMSGLTQNENLTPAQIDKIFASNRWGEVDADFLAANPPLTNEQFNRLFEAHKEYLTENEHLEAYQVDRLLNFYPTIDMDEMAKYNPLTDEQFMVLFEDEDDEGVNKNSLAVNPSLNIMQKKGELGLLNWWGEIQRERV